MFKRIDHVEIVPSDLERTLNFYTQILGFKIKERREASRPPMQEIVFIELNDSMIEMISVKDPAPLPADPWHVSYRRIALEVEDMDKAIEYLKGKGVKISREPSTLATSKRAEIEDPDGLSIELRQWL